jgi:hypothetical protein
MPVYQSKTLRRMPPETRKLAKLINDADSLVRRLKNRIPEISQLERDSMAFYKRQDIEKSKGDDRPLFDEGV